MKTLKLTTKEIIMSAVLIFGMGGAWIQVQADISRLTHATRENAKTSVQTEQRFNSRINRLERRMVFLLNRNYKITKKVRDEQN